jgi:hypothetical protein
MRNSIGNVLLLILFLCACNGPTETSQPETTIETAPPQEIVSPTPEPTVTSASIDLEHQPLNWFGPLPPLPTNPSRPFIGSEDFMALFEPDAAWQNAAKQIQVFKLYGEWVAYQATDEELHQAVANLKQRGLALAVEAGPLNAPDSCGQGIEGFAGTEEGLLIAKRIKSAGGTIHLIALDEPYFFAHFYDGENACRWSAEKIAEEVDNYIKTMQTEFPEAIIGDTEPLNGNADANAYIEWLDTFHKVNGYQLAFLHMDVDWGRINWPQEVKAIENHGREIGVPVGIIYTGNSIDQTDKAWLEAAGEHVKKYELQAGGQPAHVLFQSWNDKPDFVLPETSENTFTQFINDYFKDKTALGFRREGAGANLALEKTIQASRQIPDNPAWMAVDGNPGTWWSAEDGPPNWIEIDLEAEYDISQFQLIPSQYPAGRTVHKLLVKGSGTENEYMLLTTFDAETQDGEALSFSPDTPISGIQFVRIETTVSPSWVAWREIKIIAAGE